MPPFPDLRNQAMSAIDLPRLICIQPPQRHTREYLILALMWAEVFFVRPPFFPPR